MSLPIDRSAKAVLDTNLVNGILSDGPKIKNSEDVVYNTIDELYNYTANLVAGGVLQPYPAFFSRQAMINPGFAANQRAVSGTVTLAAGAYGHDRWKAGAAGCTYTFATSANVTTITITAGSLIQVIEGINLSSGTYTLSWIGTAQGKIGAGSYGASGITGTATGGTNLNIEFNVGTLSKVGFNAGNQALPFQPRSFAEELQLCKRYCHVITDTANANFLIGFGTAAVATVAFIGLPLPVQMRVIPTLVATATDWALNDGSSAAIALTVIGLQSGQISNSAVTIRATVASGMTQFRPYILNAVAINKLMIFDAEI